MLEKVTSGILLCFMTIFNNRAEYILRSMDRCIVLHNSHHLCSKRGQIVVYVVQTPYLLTASSHRLFQTGFLMLL